MSEGDVERMKRELAEEYRVLGPHDAHIYIRDTLQDRVGRWGEVTFPVATRMSIAKHLLEEADELVDATEYIDDELARYPTHDVDFWVVYREMADMHLLLLHMAHRYGVDLNDLTEQRFRQAQGRTFGPSEKGYWKTTSGGDDE